MNRTVSLIFQNVSYRLTGQFVGNICFSRRYSANSIRIIAPAEQQATVSAEYPALFLGVTDSSSRLLDISFVNKRLQLTYDHEIKAQFKITWNRVIVSHATPWIGKFSKPMIEVAFASVKQDRIIP